jgi:hypothetical protein
MLRSYKPILVGRRGRSVVSLADPYTERLGADP